MVGGLRDVSGMDQIVIRVAELAVTLLETRQKAVQRLRTYLLNDSQQAHIVAFVVLFHCRNRSPYLYHCVWSGITCHAAMRVVTASTRATV